jgi:tetratricopeptide (TPR) repeat protein
VFRIKRPRAFLVLFLIVAFLVMGSTLPAFPLRSLEPGSTVPDFVLPTLAGGEANVLGEGGNISVILFWATDSNGKTKRSLDLLRTLQTIGESYGDQGIVVVSVNVDAGDYKSLKVLLEQNDIVVPVLLDEREELYGAYGLFILPTVAIVDRDGTLKTAIGYTHNISESIVGQVEIMLGLKTPEELEAELNPEEMVEVPDNIKQAQSHLNLGRIFMEKRSADMAGPEFQKAVELDPQNAEAHAELGAFHVQKGEYDKAQSELEKAIELDPDTIKGRYALGVLYRKKGEFDKAISNLEAVLEMKPGHARALRELGRVFEDQGDLEKALDSYREALSAVFEEVPPVE